MNWDRIEGNWKQFTGKAREKWRKLTDDDWTMVAGKKDQLVGKIQERYGIQRDEAQKEADEWARALKEERGLNRNNLLGWRVLSRVYGYLAIFLLAVLSSVAQTPGTPARQGNSSPPITAPSRLQWFATSTVGPPSLIGGTISAGWGTLFNAPKEYGPHWDGFAKRYGMRFTGISVSNAMEAGFGALWGEDPRYFRAEGQPFNKRIGRIVKMTFLAYDSQGRTMPAYARYAAISGNNFLSNTWRADSEATAGHAVERTLTGFLGRMASNAFAEFWPDVRQRLFERKNP